MKSALYLLLAILFEVCGSTMLNLSNGFTILWPSIATMISYMLSFICLGLALDGMDLSTAYAIWAGLGTALTACVGIVLFNEEIGFLKVFALVCIIIGVVILNKSRDANEVGQTEQIQ